MLEIPKRSSLISQTAEALRKGIGEGLWTESLPGERSLSQELHVSRPTLRAALDILEREGLLQHEQGAPRRIVGPVRAKLAQRKTTVVVLTAVPPHLMPPASLFYLNDLRNSVQQAGLRLEIAYESGLTDNDPGPALERLTARAEVVAWILAAPSEPVQRWFAARALPVLSAGSCVPGVALPFLDLDYRAVCRHAAGLFLRHGHKRLCLFLSDSQAASDQLTEQGFLEGIELFGKDQATERIIRHDGTREDICKKLGLMLQEPSPPTAILGCRPVHVLAAVTYLSRQGKLPPSGPSFISRDSDAFLRHLTPEVSRYTIRRRTFAKRLSRLTLQLVSSQSLPPRPFLLMPEYLAGETVGSPPPQ